MADEEDVCNFANGDYKTLRLEDGKIYLFKGDKYYVFDEGDIKNAEVNSVTEIYPNDETPIDQTFLTNGKVYYLRGDDAIIYDDGKPKQQEWKRLQTKVAHVIVRRDGETTGFFVPPKSSRFGWGQSTSQSNELSIMAFGGGSLTTSSINGVQKIVYNGWNIPIEFNAFMVNPDDTITFFNGDKYCTVVRNSRQQLEWEDVNTLFGCE